MLAAPIRAPVLTCCHVNIECVHRTSVYLRSTRTNLAVIMRISASSLPQLAAHLSDGTKRVLCSGVSHLLHIRRSSLAVFEVPCPWSYRAAILSATYPMAHLWWRRG